MQKSHRIDEISVPKNIETCFVGGEACPRTELKHVARRVDGIDAFFCRYISPIIPHSRDRREKFIRAHMRTGRGSGIKEMGHLSEAYYRNAEVNGSATQAL